MPQRAGRRGSIVARHAALTRGPPASPGGPSFRVDRSQLVLTRDHGQGAHRDAIAIAQQGDHAAATVQRADDDLGADREEITQTVDPDITRKQRSADDADYAETAIRR